MATPSTDTSTSTARSPAPTTAPASSSQVGGPPAVVSQPGGNQAALAVAGLFGTGGDGATAGVILSLLEELPGEAALRIAWPFRRLGAVAGWLARHSMEAVVAAVPTALDDWLAEWLPEGRSIAGAVDVGATAIVGGRGAVGYTVKREGGALKFDVSGTLAALGKLGLGKALTDGTGILTGATLNAYMEGLIEARAGWDVPFLDGLLRGMLAGAFPHPTSFLEVIPLRPLAEGLRAVPPSRAQFTSGFTPGKLGADVGSLPAYVTDTAKGEASGALSGRATIGYDGGRSFYEATVDAAAGILATAGLSNVVEGLGDDALLTWSARTGRSLTLRVTAGPPASALEAERATLPDLTFDVTTKGSETLGRAGVDGVKHDTTDKLHFSSLSGLLSWLAQPAPAEDDLGRLLALPDAARGADKPVPDVWVERSVSVGLRSDDAVEAVAPGFLDDLARALPDSGQLRGTRDRRVEASVKVGVGALRRAFAARGEGWLHGADEHELVALEQAVLDAVVAAIPTGARPMVAGVDVSGALPEVGLKAPTVVVERVIGTGMGFAVGAGGTATGSGGLAVTVTDRRPAPVGDIGRLLVLLAA